MELKQELKLKQTLSQNMILSARILQMGQIELQEYLEDLAMENPVVDLEEVQQEKDKGNEDDELLHRLEELKNLDRQNSQYYQYEEEEAGRFEPAGDTAQTLEESLLEQLHCMKMAKDEFRIMEYMILNLNESGYLSCGFEELCRELNLSEEDGEQILLKLKKLEPRGIGARSLRECLLWQLEECDAPAPIIRLAELIIFGYLEELGKNRMELLAKKLKSRLADVLEARKLIQSLNPRPGSGYGSSRYQKYLVPDVMVVELDSGFEIVMNDGTFPRLGINSYYLSLMKSSESEEAVSYIRDKVKQAQWACRCVDQRNKTLFLLVQEIVRVQRSFFESGRKMLVPLTQKTVAGRLMLNESTISRAVREKYLQCRWGIFPLQFFFSRSSEATDSSTASFVDNDAGSLQDGPENQKADGSGAMSAEAVKEQIRQIVAGENKRKPFSDRLLAEKLQEYGVHISRRTVAKYREAMGLADASGRKEFE